MNDGMRKKATNQPCARADRRTRQRGRRASPARNASRTFTISTAAERADETHHRADREIDVPGDDHQQHALAP